MSFMQKRYARRSLFKAIGAAAGDVVAAKIGSGADAAGPVVQPDPNVCTITLAKNHGFTGGIIMNSGVNDVGYETLPFPRPYLTESTSFDSAGYYKEYIPAMREPPPAAMEATLRGLSEWRGGRARAFPVGARFIDFGPFPQPHRHEIK